MVFVPLVAANVRIPVYVIVKLVGGTERFPKTDKPVVPAKVIT